MNHSYIDDYSINTSCDRFYKLGWHQLFSEQKRNVENNKCDLVIIGDSIAKGFSRYHDIWNSFKDFNALNLGIGGDKTQHVLWRCQQIDFPSSLKYVFLIWETNNVDQNLPSDITDSLLRIGLSFITQHKDINELYNILAQHKNIKVFISALLPRDFNKNSIRRHKIIECNRYLEKNCSLSNENIIFIPQRSDEWLEDDGTLRCNLYHTDFLHLSKSGY